MPWWAAASAALAAVLALYGIYLRHQVEASNRAVGMAAEMSALADLASLNQVGVEQVLAEFRKQGLNGVVLQEETVADLQNKGALRLETSGASTLLQGSPGALARALAYGRLRFGDAAFTRSGSVAPGVLTFTGSIEQLRATGLGIDANWARLARAQGYEVIVRHGNVMGASPELVAQTVKASREAGALWFLPMGDQVLGRRGSLEAFVAALRDEGMSYLTPEFVKIGGDSNVREKAKDITLRLHSIQAAEIDRMTQGAVVERYVKAFRERGIRWLLLRPISYAGSNAKQEFLNLAARVREGVRAEKGDVKTPKPWTEPDAPIWLFPAISAAAVPCLFWCAMALFPSWWIRGPILAILVLLAAACLRDSARPYFALAAATGFPVAACLWLCGRERTHPLLGMGVLFCLSLVGGLIVSGTLIGVTWTLQNDQFSGVKVAHFLPIAIAAVILLMAQGGLKKTLSEPITWGTAVLGLVVVGAVAFMLSRTGNDNPAGVSELELGFRSLLDKILYTRPRTKEFLIGHPALILGLGLLWDSQTRRELAPWGAVLAAIGAIGLTSVVNTFCHLHSPVELAFARVGIGLVIGCILGFAAWGVVRVLLMRLGQRSTT